MTINNIRTNSSKINGKGWILGTRDNLRLMKLRSSLETLLVLRYNYDSQYLRIIIKFGVLGFWGCIY
jgi:hypothetical protein